MIRFYYQPIPPTPRDRRREAEQQAVAHAVAMAFGEHVKLCHREDGAPYINPCPAGTWVSITHSADQCILAVTDEGPIGIDTETARTQLERIRDKFISPTDAVTPDLHGLLKAWTVKEAVYKAALTPGLALTDITILPGQRQATARGMIYRLSYPTLTPARVTAVATRKATVEAALKG